MAEQPVLKEDMLRSLQFKVTFRKVDYVRGSWWLERRQPTPAPLGGSTVSRNTSLTLEGI